ncbi:hypothetical protein B0H17DRAFT_1136199 [Mycena rosella]|uniref:Uncharacterized protein n=1 Tax=Mycena rosella TaxID=1033263 RepID=A0AAD7DBK8_MYCRO|nr:hypothetical protein B0H17DRAFT_1136199 [Mycena rosella]
MYGGNGSDHRDIAVASFLSNDNGRDRDRCLLGQREFFLGQWAATDPFVTVTVTSIHVGTVGNESTQATAWHDSTAQRKNVCNMVNSKTDGPERMHAEGTFHAKKCAFVVINSLKCSIREALSPFFSDWVLLAETRKQRWGGTAENAKGGRISASDFVRKQGLKDAKMKLIN